MERSHERLERQEKGLTVIIMGSESDRGHSSKIVDGLKQFEVACEERIASAHKSPEHLDRVLEEYNSRKNVVFLTVAGKSDALSATVAARTAHPVIAVPPYDDKYGGVNIFSSLMTPSGVAVPVINEPGSAAIHVAKIFALNDPLLAARILEHQRRLEEKIIEADVEIQNQNFQKV